MKKYSSFEEMSLDLKILNLERRIAFEKLKGIGGKVESDISVNWINSLIGLAKRMGMVYLTKKFFGK